MTKPFQYLTGALSLLVSALILVSCGGGGAGALLASGVGSGGTGIGIITGFGSVIIDGTRYTDTGASLSSDEDQASGGTIASTDLRLGQEVDYTLDASGNLATAVVSPALVGSVAATSGLTLNGAAVSGIRVLGVTVTVNADASAGPVTNYVGYSNLASVQVGDRVAVYGVLKNDNTGSVYVQASLIVLKPATSTGVRVSGYVAQYNAATGSFALGSYTVSAAAASIVPSTATLANGELVSVWANAAPTGNTITASTIRVRKLASSTSSANVSGPVSNFVSLSQFQVRNVPVDASSATITPAGATITASSYVTVRGSFDATANLLKASAVTVASASDVDSAELHGTITNFVSNANFMVRGVVVDAHAATVSGGNLSDLQNGVYVEVHGAISNGKVVATTLKIDALTPSQISGIVTLDATGTISGYNASTGAYTLTTANGTAISGVLSSSTQYRNGTAASFAVGAYVAVSGSYASGSLGTTTIRYLGVPAVASSDHNTKEFSGPASAVTATSFVVNGVTIQINGVTVRGGTLINGITVEVEASFNATSGQWLASAISIDD